MTETSATKPPQLRAARARKQSIIKFVILFVTLAFLFVPLLAMLIFTLRHPLSGRWSAAPWIAIFTGNGESLGADLTVLWQGIGTSLALSAVTVVIMLVLLVPTMVIVHIRSKVLERAIEWVATLPLTIPAIVLVVGLGPIYRWLSADVLSTNPIWLCFAYVILVMPFAFRALAVGLNSIDVKTLVEASRSLGASWPKVFFKVIIPNLWQSILSASFISIAVVLGVPMDAMLAYGIVVAGLFASMACATMFSIQAISFVQLETPGHLVGKVIALTMSLANCAQPVGQLIYGGLFDALRGNLVPVALGTAAIAFVIGLVTFRVLRKGLAELQAAVPGAADAR